MGIPNWGKDESYRRKEQARLDACKEIYISEINLILLWKWTRLLISICAVQSNSYLFFLFLNIIDKLNHN